MDAALISSFLEHLETVRGNTAETRNIRLAAICSSFRQDLSKGKFQPPDKLLAFLKVGS
jgi:hypothetical protein